MFLINIILSNKGIFNGFISIITTLCLDNRVETAFPTKNSVQVGYRALL